MLTTSELLSPEETAKKLGVTTGTLAIWRCKKRYPLPYVKVGSKVRYRSRDIERFLNERTVAGSGKRSAA